LEDTAATVGEKPQIGKVGGYTIVFENVCSGKHHFQTGQYYIAEKLMKTRCAMIAPIAKRLASMSIAAIILLFQAGLMYGHCDTMDGPVVLATKQALQSSDVTPVLKWVKSENEKEIRDAFQKTLLVRKSGPEARELADMYFFETLVRVHRAGEGAPYTGLKSAGSEISPAVREADASLEKGDVEHLVSVVTETVTSEIRQRFAETAETKKHASENVDAGRRFVAAYVEFVHYVERLYEAAVSPAGHHDEVHGTSIHDEKHSERETGKSSVGHSH
jgi:hypothetical protein